MKKFYFFLAIIFSTSVLSTKYTSAQSKPTIAEVNNLLKGNHFLVTYREGEVLYGTYYFIDIHYCQSGYYGLYGRSVKKTVLGNEQNNNWQEFGNWKIIEYNGNTGIYYKPTNAAEKFYPAYRLPNGNLSFGEGVSIVYQGKAVCN